MSKKITLKLETKLKALELSCLDVVLEEIFFIWQASKNINSIKTIADLSQICGLSPDEIMRRLRELIRCNESIKIDKINLHRLVKEKGHSLKDLICLDASFPHEKRPFTGSLGNVHFLWEENLSDFIKNLKVLSAAKLIFCSSGKRSYSAAMYLKRQGVNDLYYVKPELLKDVVVTF
ncbi:MAG: hypothetical protein CMP11_03015 [Zetaproteobacteria bacterium]|nr:hypothetical protein [Pseudobdellovibrionaceae bacterium]|tara:strand:+ start:1478 stop:2008 length:531 start_codon:yes stop_codon:yes gene_type:complete